MSYDRRKGLKPHTHRTIPPSLGNYLSSEILVCIHNQLFAYSVFITCTFQPTQNFAWYFQQKPAIVLTEINLNPWHILRNFLVESSVPLLFHRDFSLGFMFVFTQRT